MGVGGGGGDGQENCKNHDNHLGGGWVGENVHTFFKPHVKK